MRWLLLVLLAPSLALAAGPRVTSGSGSISTGPRILGESEWSYCAFTSPADCAADRSSYGGSVLLDGALFRSDDGGAWKNSTGIAIAAVGSLDARRQAWRHATDGLSLRARVQTFGVWTGAPERFLLVVENVDALTTAIRVEQNATALYMGQLTWATGVASTVFAGGNGSILARKLFDAGPSGGPVYLLEITVTGPVGTQRRIYVRPTGSTNNTHAVVLHYAHHDERGPVAPYIVFDGDSLTAGFGVTTPWPNRLAASLSVPIALANYAISGQQLIDMVSDAHLQIDVARYNSGAAKNILIVWGGTNDMAAGGQEAQVIFDRLASYAAERRRAGWTVVVLTMLPRNGVDGADTRRSAFNALVRANYSTFAHALVDVAADARVGDKGDELNTTYYQADATHLNDTGMQVIADLVDPVVEGLIAP